MGWHSRGYLPHFDDSGAVQSITFRLHDAVPAEVIQAWKNELEWRDEMAESDPESVELRRRIGRFEDAGHGNCWLRSPALAEDVENALLHFDGDRYRLLAWCVMPNHVHAMGEFHLGGVSQVVHSWKSFTSKAANKKLGRNGEFWMPDYFDRFIRNEVHFEAARNYIEANPTKAGLAAPGEWRWCSGWRGRPANV